MTRTLMLKALRDAWHVRTQALAIALVIGAGIANLVMSQSCYVSLQETRERFYRDYGFADAFAHLKRAPESVAAELAAIDGVEQVETRLVSRGTLKIEGFDDPVKAQVVSLPREGGPLMNRIYLRAGREPEPGARTEVLLSEAFAQAHGLVPGDTLAATVYGRNERFEVVGIALSPEYVYQIQPGAAFPDFRRFAILWIDREALEAALDMDGAFNDVTLKLERGARTKAVLAALDATLARYGGLGAYAREDQLSNRFLSEELKQLATMATLFPTIFLSVAAFLLNVVLTRLVGTQRDQIAILKAFGYADRAIALHFALLVALIVAVGTAIGLGGGVALGKWLAGVYQDFYRFPFLDYRVGAGVFATGFAVSLAAALVGTASAVYRAARLPPAEAMRPPAPDRFRPTVIERLGFQRLLSQPTRIIVRGIERRPLKSLLTVLGLALACAIMMVGRFQRDAIDFMIDVQFRVGQRNDVSVDFAEIAPRRAAFELRALPGVRMVEPYRSAPVRLHGGARSYRTALQGLQPDGSLKRPVDRGLARIELPEHGVLLTDHLAKILGVRPGDLVEVKVLEGRRRRVEVEVAALVSEYIGVSAYMSLDAMNRLLGDGDVVSGAYLAVEREQQVALYRALEERPRVAGVGTRLNAIRNFYDTLGESLLVFTFVALVLGGVINFGVVYNSARIALSERARELASLRVLGFTEGEVAYILLGELAILVAASIPLGFLAGWGLCWYMALGLQSDLYRIPVTVSPNTLGFAASAMVVSAALSALIVRRRVHTLDLIGVLKTRD
ncbi:MAG TPA: FtsX-like permease family protein [Xanthomonadales bacterium]|nr:FtsX-like permease family protein [Xanthomonadales bacterium]